MNVALPILETGLIDWHEWHEARAVDAFAMARGFLESARLCQPDKYLSDQDWIAYFVKEARRYNQCGVWHRNKAKEYANV